MAGILVSPSFDVRVRKRRELYKKKNESPNFRELLRERCRARIKARRGALFDQFRNINSKEDAHDVLSEMLHDDITFLKNGQFSDPEPMDFSCSTPSNSDDEIDERDRWILEEYERILEEEESFYQDEWENHVICPLCQKASLKQRPDLMVECPHCSSLFPRVQTLAHLHVSIIEASVVHQTKCSSNPQFALLCDPDFNGLFISCSTCGHFSNVL